MQCTSFVDDPDQPLPLLTRATPATTSPQIVRYQLLLLLTRTIDTNPDTRDKDVARERRPNECRLGNNLGLVRRWTGQPAVVSTSETRQRRNNQN